MRSGLKVTAVALIASAFLTGCTCSSRLPADAPTRLKCKDMNCGQLQAELDFLRRQKREWEMAREPERLHLARLEALTGREQNFGLCELDKLSAEEKVVRRAMEQKGCR